MSNVLVLTNSYLPHRVVSWQKAITLVFSDKAEVVESHEDEEISSVSVTLKMPTVIRLLATVRGNKRVVKFSRVNIMIRDKYRCQYCGTKLPMSQLTFDHVLPRSRGGVSSWTNVVTACKTCNYNKADMTPEEAKMPLRSKPERPESLPISMLRFNRSDAHSSWATYLYWKSELDE